jgi:hypothetical protein
MWLIGVMTVYLVLGVPAVLNWPTWRESGRTFLLLVFPGHAVLYLMFANCGSGSITEAIRNGIVLLIFILLLIWMAR